MVALTTDTRADRKVESMAAPMVVSSGAVRAAWKADE